MKVLLINEECGCGSTGRICTDIADALEAQGHEVKIAYGRNADLVPEKYQKYAVRIGNDFDVKIHGLKARLFDAAGFGSVYSTKKFIKWVQKYNPDIIHMHNLHGYYINIEILFDYLRTCQKKIIWTLHDVWAFTGHSAYCDAAQCDKWKYECSHCPQRMIYPKAFIDRSRRNWSVKKDLFSGLTGLEIVTPSNWLADLVKQSFLKDYIISVIHNGIDTSQFYPMKSDFRKRYGLANKIIVLSVASVWNDLKGYSDIMTIASVLGDAYRFVLVGGRDQAPKVSVPNNIIFINRTQSIREMAELYSAADVYLNLTYCDTYPTVNLEAGACGTPIISYEVGGSTESTLTFGGIVVHRGDKESVVNALKKGINKASIDNMNTLDKKWAVSQYMKKYEGT